MSAVGDFIGDTIGGITGSKQAGEAAQEAGAAQAQAAMAGVEETRRQFDKMVEIMSPYTQAGVGALSSQQNLLGLGGPEAQQQAIAQIESSPYLQSLQKQGEEAMLQNASATGGLRGGNIQASLAQYRPQLLNQAIQQQYANLAGLTSLGQASAAGVGAGAQQTGANIANLLGQAGAAQAGGIMGQGQVVRNTFGDAMGFGGMFVGAGGMPGLSKLF